MGAALPVSAVALGNVTPTRDNGRLQPAVIEGQNQKRSTRNFEGLRCGLQALEDVEAGEFAYLQRRFERAGFNLYLLADENLLVTGWGQSSTLRGIGCARAFLAANGGAQ